MQVKGSVEHVGNHQGLVLEGVQSGGSVGCIIGGATAVLGGERVEREREAAQGLRPMGSDPMVAT